MAEEIGTGASQEGEPQGEPDYKALYEAEKAAHEKTQAESRKWEKRSKANVEKAGKWDAATAGDASIEERIAKLEADKKALEDAAARSALVSEVAKATGVPEAIVGALNGADLEQLTSQAQAVAAAYKPTGAPKAPEAGRFPREQGQAADADKRKFVRDLLGKTE